MSRKYIDELLNEFSEEELDRTYYVLEDLKFQFQFERHLAKKGIQIGNLDLNLDTDWNSLQLQRKWDKTFATLTEDEKRAIYFYSYRWHICSYDKVSCLDSQAAREAFDKVKKSTLFFMYEHARNVQTFQHASTMTSTDLDSQDDIYVFDETFSWTYIHTHEDSIGPYFIWNDHKAK